MATNILKSRFGIFFLMNLFAILVLSSCSKESTTPYNQVDPVIENTLKSVNIVNSAGTTSGQTTVPTIATVTLLAGQTINVGSLVINETDTNADGIDDALAVTYNLTGGWQLSEIQFWIGSSLTLLPTNNGGNPVLGKFPYKPTDVAAKTSYTITVPFSAIGYSTCEALYYIAAHASVYNGKNSQTAWSDGTVLNPKGQWATYTTIDIVDNTPPSISGTITGITVEGCSATDAPAAATTIGGLETLGLKIADARTTKDKLVITSADVVTGSCPIVVTRTYTIADACGNKSTAVQIINVVDTTPPTALPLKSDTVQCIGDVPAANISLVSASDNCSTPVVKFVSDVNSGTACSTEVTRTYSVTDACGNSINVTQLIIVKDITAPVLSGQGVNGSVTSPELPVFTPPTAIDNCDAKPVISYTDVTVAGTTSSTVTRTWIATDACGNVSTPVSQTITVNVPEAPIQPTGGPTVSVLTGTNTAWAYSSTYSTAFTSVSDFTGGKWGWTNGALSNGTYTFDLIAGAGGNTLDHGTNVGTVTVVYSGSTATVTYNAVSPYKIDVAQLYIGSAQMPLFHSSPTAAPGQLGHTSSSTNFTSYTFTVTNLSGQIYVMAHADVTAQ